MENNNASDLLRGLSSSIERGGNTPVIIVDYGFREEVTDGKTCLTPLTKQEYIEAVRSLNHLPQKELDSLVSRIESGNASCRMTSKFQCVTLDGCQTCSLGNVGTSYFCCCDMRYPLVNE